MPHSRKRFLEPVIRSALSWSPVVGLFGLRQVGKTTLVKELTDALKGEFETFDREIILQRARETPAQFLQRDSLLTIDEAQKAPQIFSIMKDLIGIKRKPGRFLLTGSVRFTLKKEIRESLTGRIVMKELLPFSLAEALQIEKSVFLKEAFHALSGSHHGSSEHSLFDQFKRKLKYTSPRQLSRLLVCGGLPVPCFARDSQKRKMWFEAYFETLLTRDVVLVEPSLFSLSFRQGLSFLKELALAQGNEVILSDSAIKSSLTPLMARRLLRTLEILALVDMIPPDIRSQKAIRKSQVEWKDSGLWGYLTGQEQDNCLSDIKAVHLLLTQEFRSQISDFDDAIFWYFYRNRDGADIPWIFKKGGQSVALKFYPSEVPASHDWRILKKFVNENKSSLALVLGPEKSTPTVLDKKIWFLPFNLVF